MIRILRNERGMALALAIVALVVAGALIAGAFFAGTQEQRVGENSRRSYQSFGIAEAGIRADQGATVSTNGGGTVTGVPPVLIDPSVSDSTFSEFGDVTYTDLAARANWTLPGQNFSSTIAPVVTNGQCDKTIATNWGDPLDPTAPCGG